MRGDKAAVYLRVSSQRQATRGYGLQIQEESCQKYCNSRGYELVETYQDTKTGVNQERPGLQVLLSELGSRGIQVVVCYSMDRLTRDTDDWHSIREALHSRGIRLEFSDARLNQFENTMQNVLSLHG